MYQTVNGYDLSPQAQGLLLKKLLGLKHRELKYLCIQDNFGLRLDIGLKNCISYRSDGSPQCEKDGTIKQYLTLAIEVSGVDTMGDCRYLTEEPVKTLNEFMILASHLGYRTCSPSMEHPIQEILYQAIKQQHANAFCLKVKQVLHNQTKLLGNYATLLQDIPADASDLKRVYDIELLPNDRLRLHTICLNTQDETDFHISSSEHGRKLALFDPCKGHIILKSIVPEFHAEMREKYIWDDLARTITKKAKKFVESKTPGDKRTHMPPPQRHIMKCIRAYSMRAG